ncbi:MAG: hypothetical protein WCC17_08500 [Candidatus Nitrosopolaris sp.]
MSHPQTREDTTELQQEQQLSSSDAIGPCKCKCGHIEVEHMPPDQGDRMCEHAECTWSYTSVLMDNDTDTQKTTGEGHKAAEESECERKVETSADENAKSETGAIKRDEEISACFDRAKENLNGLLKSKRHVIRDLAEELEQLGRRIDNIAAEIVDGLHGCEEISNSLIYSYLDDKYKDQTQV